MVHPDIRTPPGARDATSSEPNGSLATVTERQPSARFGVFDPDTKLQTLCVPAPIASVVAKPWLPGTDGNAALMSGRATFVATVLSAPPSTERCTVGLPAPGRGSSAQPPTCTPSIWRLTESS